jgi:hypothetical protein
MLRIFLPEKIRQLRLGSNLRTRVPEASMLTTRSKSLCAPEDYSAKNTQIYFKHMSITEHIQNADRAILNTVFENTVQHVNKCLETGGGHFEHYL